MTRHLALLKFTEQGIQKIQESHQRAAEFRNDVEAAGGRVIAQYWAIGEYDGCVLFESPDAVTAMALLLQLGKEGNVSTSSMQVFEGDEFDSILDVL